MENFKRRVRVFRVIFDKRYCNLYREKIYKCQSPNKFSHFISGSELIEDDKKRLYADMAAYDIKEVATELSEYKNGIEEIKEIFYNIIWE